MYAILLDSAGLLPLVTQSPHVTHLMPSAATDLRRLRQQAFATEEHHALHAVAAAGLLPAGASECCRRVQRKAQQAPGRGGALSSSSEPDASDTQHGSGLHHDTGPRVLWCFFAATASIVISGPFAMLLVGTWDRCRFRVLSRGLSVVQFVLFFLEDHAALPADHA